MNKRRLLEWGGVAAGVILIAFGIGSLVLSIAGHNEVGRSSRASTSSARRT